MLKFKALDIGDRELFMKYLKGERFSIYDYSFTALYQWRKMSNTEFCVIDDVLIIKKYTKETGAYFLQPIGSNGQSIDDVITKLYDYKKNRTDFKWLFGDIESAFLNRLCTKYGNRVTYFEDRNNFDYIYNSADLISLSGRKYHSKKNLYNQFVNRYNYEIKDIKEENVRKDCIEFANFWYESNENKDDLLDYEFEGIKDVLNNIGNLNIMGLAVYVDKKIAGITFGEKLNDKMAIVHCEKGNINYSGIYSFINKTLVQAYFKDTSCINRQEDMGLFGLRKAKMSYHPINLEKKYFADLMNLV